MLFMYVSSSFFRHKQRALYSSPQHSARYPSSATLNCRCRMLQTLLRRGAISIASIVFFYTGSISVSALLNFLVERHQLSMFSYISVFELSR
jgi:hypothetical protein